MIINRCPICGTIIEYGLLCCNVCKEKIRKEYLSVYMDRCIHCFSPKISDDYACKCRQFFCYSITDWKNPFSRRVLIDFKFNNMKQYAPLIAKTVYLPIIQELNWQNRTLVPVPCSKEGYKKKGYNHMELIAKKTGLKYLNILKSNNFDAVQQKKLNRQQRLEYAMKKYSIVKNDIPKNTSLLLIDDITTTGSTLKACHKVLSNAGFTDISAITWFIEF